MVKTLQKNIGVDYDKSFLMETFVPIAKKYIVIDNSANAPSKEYPFWSDVIQIIKDYIGDIKIYCLGGAIPEATQIPQNIHQINYVIRNSLLLAGNYSYSCYIAANHNTPFVTVYGTFDPKVCEPESGINKISLFPKKDGKPSFDFHDRSEIRKIKPEEVASHIIRLLKIEAEIKEKTIFIGENYPQRVIEIVPDSVINPASMQSQIPVIRVDYYDGEHLEENLFKNLSQFKAAIITDKETDLNLYRKLRENIAGINFKVSLDTNLNYIRKLRNIGIDVKLWAEDDIKEIRFKFLDIDLIHHVKHDLHEDVDIVGKKYRSLKIILARNKGYPSKYAWAKDLPLESVTENFSTINENSLDFRQEMGYFRIYE